MKKKKKMKNQHQKCQAHVSQTQKGLGTGDMKSNNLKKPICEAVRKTVCEE